MVCDGDDDDGDIRIILLYLLITCVDVCVNLDGRHLASFFIDPYARRGQKSSGDWMLCGRG